jgi:O-antigen/teichoic acid export membrane protein
MTTPAAPAPPPASLRRNFVWTIAGNVVYGASQWAVLSLIAKLGSAEMLGNYALAIAVASPAAMLSHLNLRAVIATDMARQHPCYDYLAVRFTATAASLIGIAAIAFASGFSRQVALATVLMGLALGSETVSDAYFGFMQRREQLDQVARSMIVRAALSVAALGATLWFTRDLVAAVFALALGRIAVLLVYDRPRGTAGEDLRRTGTSAQWLIFRTALPLGVVLMLVSLANNVPRYAIEADLGARELGVFAAAASFITAGGAIASALGQAVTPRLALYFSAGDLRAYRRLARQSLAISLALGACGIAGAALLGKFILRILYRPEYAAYSGLLVALMAAGTLTYVATMLGYLLTSARAFRPQMPLLIIVTAVSAAASYLLVPRMGLGGAALAIALAAVVQIAGAAGILRMVEARCAR